MSANFNLSQIGDDLDDIAGLPLIEPYNGGPYPGTMESLEDKFGHSVQQYLHPNPSHTTVYNVATETYPILTGDKPPVPAADEKYLLFKEQWHSYTDGPCIVKPGEVDNDLCRKPLVTSLDDNPHPICGEPAGSDWQQSHPLFCPWCYGGGWGSIVSTLGMNTYRCPFCNEGKLAIPYSEVR